MKKKNVVGHMVASKTASKNWFRRLKLLPRLVCLLVAVVIWLLIVNLIGAGNSEIPEEPNLPITEYSEA